MVVASASVNVTRVALVSVGSSPTVPCDQRHEKTWGGSTGMVPWTPWSKSRRPPGRRSTLTGSPLPNQRPEEGGFGEHGPDPADGSVDHDGAFDRVGQHENLISS